MITLTVDLGAPCPKCKKPGSVNGGLCFKCAERRLMEEIRKAKVPERPRRKA